MRKRETGQKFHFSKLSCPACGDETRAVLRVGTVRVRCERCGALLEMTIRLIETRRSRFIGTGATPACPTGGLPAHAVRPPRPTFRGYTELMCPTCGRRTGASVRTGTAIVYCRRCRGLIEMTVEVVRELEEACLLHRQD
ncbi:MAG TPA: hypothetical protein VMY39_00850 [Planctomycetota bacterium]|nr:hypothetical protein [Planctomycetota bacterium]